MSSAAAVTGPLRINPLLIHSKVSSNSANGQKRHRSDCMNMLHADLCHCCAHILGAILLLGMSQLIGTITNNIVPKLYVNDWMTARQINVNPCPAELIKMPHPLLIFSQSDCLIFIVAINSHT